MTFQNLLSRIPKWNNEMITQEKERIMKLCNCSYLEDLMTCVHIIQLKILSCVRVGNESKKITIDIPDFGAFLHKVYINVARKLYSNIYLFEIDIPNLDIQKRINGYLPLVRIRSDRTDKTDRMAATIRHNRARGKHRVEAMSDIVVDLKKRNWSDDRISRELGMEADEVLRLCQLSGLSELFNDQEFSQSWDIEENKDEFIALEEAENLS